MIGRRVRPLVLVLALGALLLVLRLWQVQVLEHELWAAEAARQVLSGESIPYRRGRILDTNGRVLAEDADAWRVVLVYRDFRRSHPLGMVAHARSALEGRPVSLEEASANLVRWAHELVQLSPAALERRTGEGEIARRRRADVRFYVQRLLGIEPRAWRAALEGAEVVAGDETSFLTLVAGLPGVEEPGEVDLLAALDLRIARSRARLDDLALRLSFEPEEDALAPGKPEEASFANGKPEEASLANGTPEDASIANRKPDGASSVGGTERLLAALEEARRTIEDAAAGQLFAEALGFPAGRVAPETLLAHVDLAWLGELLAWDDTRLAEWAGRARGAWIATWRDARALPRLVESMFLDPETSPPSADRLLDRLAALFGADDAFQRALEGDATPWREVDELAVVASLASALATDPPRAALDRGERALAFQDPQIRGAAVDPERPWEMLDALAPGEEGPSLGTVASGLARGRRRDREALVELARGIVEAWEEDFQAELARILAETRNEASGNELSPAGKLLVAAGARERAAERTEYALRDYGTRPRLLVESEPSYDVVYLVTRFSAELAGFEVRETRVRVRPVLPAEPCPAALLLGDVATLDAFALDRQRSERAELAELQRDLRRSEREEDRLLQLVGSVLRPDETRGTSGIEGYWDKDLVGRNGYRESRGLEEILGAARATTVREARAGADLVLALDASLQGAAERTLREPRPADDPNLDRAWYENPVGAIVLVTPEGDVLAAASEPGPGSTISAEASGQRTFVVERTLRIPTFQPPGSVFKQFVAAWALDRGRVDPHATVLCGPIARGGCGYKDVRCHARDGHGAMDLEQALVRSCNAYFAWLGEQLNQEDFRALADLFGFGEPCGIKAPPPWDDGLVRRYGLVEDAKALFTDALDQRELRLAGNGLTVVETTPMQLARATCGLATGRLPTLRLVRAIGENEVAHGEAKRLSLADETLAFVRRALIDVTHLSSGTASAALSPGVIGYSVAAKTGSADYTSGATDGDLERRVRKHTWVTGWLPAEDPKIVFVVFVHDTTATSSHGAVYVVRQMLESSELALWLAAHGVERNR